MKKTKLTRSLLAACSIVALSAVMYGCTHSSGPSQDDLDAALADKAAAAAEAQANADDAAAAAVAAKAEADAAAAAAAAAAATDAADAKAAADGRGGEGQRRRQGSANMALRKAAAEYHVLPHDAHGGVEPLRAAAFHAMSLPQMPMPLPKAAEVRAIPPREPRQAEADAAAGRGRCRPASRSGQAEADRLQGEVDDAAAAKASGDAKDLLNMALRNRMVDDATPPEDTGATEMDIQDRKPSPTLEVSDDDVLIAEATIEATDDAAAIVYTMADTAPDMIEGWRGAMLTNAGGDIAVVYSDIENDETNTLLDRYVSNLPAGTPPRRSWDIDENDTDDDDDDDPTVNTDNDISWTAVRRPDEMTMAGGTSANPITMFEGTVHGIPGTFSCDADGVALCASPETYSDGKVNELTANLADVTWKFTPDDGANTYTDDPNYLVFGWWLDKGEDGKPDYVRLITNAEGLGEARTETNTDGSAIRGSATYEGAAAGKYAMASAGADMYEGGHFTAMATLMVDFDADLLATDDMDDNEGIALSGMIDNFKTGDTPRPWSVTLMVDGDTGTADVAEPLENLVGDTGAGMTTEWSTGAAQNGVGTWTAEWYDSDDDAHPTAVIGTFNAHIGTDTADTGAVGRLQGAFGANKADE